MEVTLLGIVMLVRDSHQEKAPSPMEMTLLGMVIPVTDLHQEKASSPMEVTLYPSMVCGMSNVASTPVYLIMVQVWSACFRILKSEAYALNSKKNENMKIPINDLLVCMISPCTKISLKNCTDYQLYTKNSEKSIVDDDFLIFDVCYQMRFIDISHMIVLGNWKRHGGTNYAPGILTNPSAL